IPLPAGLDLGELGLEEEDQLALPGLPRRQQFGYLVIAREKDREEIAEVMSGTIISTETEEPIAALAIGFKPVEPDVRRTEKGMRSGIWLNDRLHFPSLAGPARAS